jgi:hypothetical protein
MDLRRDVASVVAVVGGGADVTPGLRRRLALEVRAVAGERRGGSGRFAHLAACVERAALRGPETMPPPSATVNYAAWLGGSVFSSVEASVASLAVSRARYGVEGARCLPDWLSLDPAATLRPPPEPGLGEPGGGADPPQRPPQRPSPRAGGLASGRAAWVADGDGGWAKPGAEGV